MRGPGQSILSSALHQDALTPLSLYPITLPITYTYSHLHALSSTALGKVHSLECHCCDQQEHCFLHPHALPWWFWVAWAARSKENVVLVGGQGRVLGQVAEEACRYPEMCPTSWYANTRPVSIYFVGFRQHLKLLKLFTFSWLSKSQPPQTNTLGEALMQQANALSKVSSLNFFTG